MEKKNKKGIKQMATKGFYHGKCGKYLNESNMLIGNDFIYCKHCKIPMLALEDSYVLGKEFGMSKIEHATWSELVDKGYLI